MSRLQMLIDLTSWSRAISLNRMSLMGWGIISTVEPATSGSSV